MKRVVGIFSAERDAKGAVNDMRQNGVRPEEILILTAKRMGEEEFGTTKEELIKLGVSVREDIPFYWSQIQQGRILVLVEPQEEAAAVYRIFQRHQSLNANYFPVRLEQPERFDGIQENVNMYYGDQQAALDPHTRRAGKAFRSE